MKRFTLQLDPAPEGHWHWYPIPTIATTACGLPAGTPGSTSPELANCPDCVKHAPDCHVCATRIPQLEWMCDTTDPGGQIRTTWNGTCPSCGYVSAYLDLGDGRGYLRPDWAERESPAGDSNP